MTTKTTNEAKQKYFGLFHCRDSIILELARDSDECQEWLDANPLFPEEEEIVWAAYHLEYYEGFATMLFVKNGKLYEYSGSHCSCNGLEEQNFYAGETTWGAIAARDPEGFLWGEYYNSAESREVLRALVQRNLKNGEE